MRRAAAVTLGILVALMVGSTLTFLCLYVFLRALEATEDRLEDVPLAVAIPVALAVEWFLGWVSAVLAAGTGEQVAGRVGGAPSTPAQRPGRLRAVLAYVLGVAAGLAVSAIPIPLTMIANEFHFLFGLLFFAAPTAGLLAARAILRGFPARGGEKGDVSASVP